MSKRLSAVLLCALAAAFVLAEPGMAQPAESGPSGEGMGQRGRMRPEGAPPRERGEAMIDRIVKELQLTSQQEPQVRQALDTHFQAVRSWFDENGGKMRELWGQLR